MNDPELVEALKYLLVPKEERVKAELQKFDPKKNVFAADNKEGYIGHNYRRGQGQRRFHSQKQTLQSDHR